MRAEKQFNEIVDSEGIFHYDKLNENEKKIADHFFQDGGRNLAPFFFGIYYFINFIIFSMISIIMDIIVEIRAKMRKKRL
jgi:hypothetical protein